MFAAVLPFRPDRPARRFRVAQTRAIFRLDLAAGPDCDCQCADAIVPLAACACRTSHIADCMGDD